MTNQELRKLTKEDLIAVISRLNYKSKENFEHELEFYLERKEFIQNNKKIEQFENASNEFIEYYKSLKIKYNLPDNCSLPQLHKTLHEDEFENLAELEKKYYYLLERLK